VGWQDHRVRHRQQRRGTDGAFAAGAEFDLDPREMWPLQDPLSAQYRTVSVDWPGFGDKARPAVGWKPAAYAAFLQYILDTVAPGMQ
jgi:hypothetical protein